MSQDPRIEAAERAIQEHLENDNYGVLRLKKSSWPEAIATAALAAADEAAAITTVEELDALPVGARVVMGEYLIEQDADVVDDGVWIDLGNGLRLDAETLGSIINSHPARVVRWGTK